MVASRSSKRPSAKTNAGKRAALTIETARLLCPTTKVAENVATAFALDLPDFEGIRETHARGFRDQWKSFDESLNERATMMHFQRLTAALVGSATGAGRFYTQKVTEARDATSKLANLDRDEDRDPVAGFDSKADRVRKFAADMAMQAYALLAAAEGAIEAYQEITGEDWKAYEAEQENPGKVERRSAAAELGAFEA
jgi:hypothetical protein